MRSLFRRGIALFVISAVSHSAVKADVFSNVPEAAEYTLVYDLDIPASVDYSFVAPAYSVDASASVGFFDRVAYYLELDGPGGLQYVYASADAFTRDAARVGVPTASTGAVFQQNLSALNVVSNVPSIVQGPGISTGNIEFWPGNYATANSANVPGASANLYDWGDQPVTGNYGSMQIHNYGAGQTLFGFSRWGGFGSGSSADLGIGNQSSGQPDWTFAQNAAQYSLRKMQVLAREVPPPPLLLEAPSRHLVVQRSSDNDGAVEVAGNYSGDITRIEARAVPIPGFGGTATTWQEIDGTLQGGTFAADLIVPAGWYDIEVRGLSGDVVVGTETVGEVGVGDVFVTAGQSNSANWGAPPLVPADPRVSAYGPGGWQFGSDPQPIADGTNGGTPWPALGDAMALTWDVPIGFISVGVGGTRVDQWLPGGSLYPRLRDALQTLGPDGARAVLWHQGESDYINGTLSESYAADLSAIIAQSRIDSGFDVPWGVALASFVPGRPNPGVEVIAGQQQVIAADPLVFTGAATDDLVGLEYRLSDLIHFNEAGLREHARRWSERILEYFGNPAIPADFDLDGDVDGEDFLLWQQNFGLANGALPGDGDANRDGRVDGEDFLIWQATFSVSQPRSIPEPSCGVLVGIVLLTFSRVRTVRAC